jgi:hypothetical protein
MMDAVEVPMGCTCDWEDVTELREVSRFQMTRYDSYCPMHVRVVEGEFVFSSQDSKRVGILAE